MKVRPLFSQREIQKRVRALAREISADYKGRELVVVGVLKGAFIFTADLVRYLKVPLTLDFLWLQSYGAARESSGKVKLVKDLELDPRGKDLLIVEDIVDSGLTLSYLMEMLASRQPASIKVCALLDKPGGRRVPVKVDYRGFTIPNVFVVGYGLDYAGRYRALPYIGVLEP